MKAKWDYEFSASAARHLRRLARDTQLTILQKIIALCDDPHHSPQVKRLRGSPDRFRLRVGAYRVVSRLTEDERLVTVERVRHRKEAYRDL